MTTKTRKKYSAEFKREAVNLATQQGKGVARTARNLGVNANMLGRWVR
jgi:transposase